MAILAVPGCFYPLTFLLTFFGTNMESRGIGVLLATAVTAASLFCVSLAQFFELDTETVALILRAGVFHVNLLIVLVSICLWKPMSYFTSWCTVIHAFHFSTFDLSTDSSHWISCTHTLSFTASCFVYFGFFVVSNIYGGGAPKDLLPFIAHSPLLHSFCIGWNHICPLWCHLIDGYLNSSNLQRIYGQTGDSRWIFLGIAGLFAIGQVYEWLVPNLVETYQASKVWYSRAHHLAASWQLASPQDLQRRRATLLRLGEDFVFSWAVKLPATASTILVSLLYGQCVIHRSR
ncbi:unnamed protein product [Cladocopium goreaui]|uniref:Napsin-A n=1 Tax=Cladocopium goreaui TaxID=2562237 RepID=A0A9P1BNP7_9DINO|nr:unnamed protein product [Cladocopium goreaui]